MYKKLLILLFISIFYAAEITNINVQQRTDGSGIIDVDYDLIDSEGTFPSFTVLVQISIDDGEYNVYDSSELSGDVGENVIPGAGKSIQIIAPDNTFSSNVVIKLIASAHVVTSELPFTMVGISSLVGSSSYQGETIDYNFEIMQNELTNAELVTFLETYDFTISEDDDTLGLPIYNCNSYTDYFNTPTYEDSGTNYGCTDDMALNYNSYANMNDESCIYQSDIGCNDGNAYNYDSGVNWDDCTCYYTDSYYTDNESTTNCNWSDVCFNADQPNTNCNYNSDQDLYYIDISGDGSSEFQVQDGTALVYQACDDQDAFNYPENVIQIMQNFGIDSDCFYIENNDNCLYDCDETYLDNQGSYYDDDFGNANIQDFQTQDISFQGASFVIESGEGTKPAIFNYENCVDGVIVGLMLNYYGLRFPNGEEWVKGARYDNTRCWPWMEDDLGNGIDCDDASILYCSGLYSCQTQESFDACEENADALNLACQNQCVLDNSTCQTDCGCNFDSGSTDCTEYDGDQTGCEDTGDCTWWESSESCLDECYACMMTPENGDACINNDLYGANPCNPGCECCSICDSMGGGDSCDNDCMTQCQLDTNSCYNDCNEFSNSWEYCGGQEMNDCENDHNNCTNYTYDCEGIQTWDLQSILSDEDDDYDNYGFLSHIYADKFNFIYYEDEWESGTLDVVDIQQYPEGISNFGLYDVIGNAPEIVKFNDILWLAGTSAASSYIGGFCSNSGTIFDTNMQNTHAYTLSEQSGPWTNLYGLRLVRTTGSE